jgi:glycosyltransferase involved in cell wall biosynthesis
MIVRSSVPDLTATLKQESRRMNAMHSNRESPPGLRHIVLIGNSVPRRCGIATFTSHCREALANAFPDLRIDHYAMREAESDIRYPGHVIPIALDDPLAYSEAACRIEESGAEAIWLQHEFGIFGGPAGDMILGLLDRTQLPVVTTLHTVLEHPGADERRVMAALIARSARIMVMAEAGRDILKRCYDVPDAKISMIPHGVPDRPFVRADVMKARLGWEGRKLVLTFGLLAPDKGLDVMIRAMPKVTARHPDALYVVMGATHPNLIREQGGDRLRAELVELARSLGVERNVTFIDRYVEQESLLDQLQAADIYVTPYLNPAQITSGTLSYAIGMGKPTVSTPYVQAREILGRDVGILVPFRDADALAGAICRLLDDDDLRQAYAERAYALGRRMIWSELARNVGRLLNRARLAQPTRLVPRRTYVPLAPDISAIVRMSDSTGMLQHSILSVSDRNHGYCIDDNARALMLMAQMPDLPADLRDRWTTTYASFVQHAWNEPRGKFRNFMTFDRRWCEEEGSDDSCGRTIWALGVTARDAPMEKHRVWATHLFDRTAAHWEKLLSPRSQAFMILGAAAVLDADPRHALARAMVSALGGNLLALLDHARRPDWAWFEAVLAYDNARLPQALLLAGHHLGDATMLACGFDTLAWIVARQRTPEGFFRAVGTESFGREYSPPLPFDQQPLEAQATIDAAATAHAISADGKWLDVAENSYRWFLGQNELSLTLATPTGGGCYDGLTPTGVNLNQGAESLLALQLASCAMRRLFGQGANMAHGAWAGSEQALA